LHAFVRFSALFWRVAHQASGYLADSVGAELNRLDLVHHFLCHRREVHALDVASSQTTFSKQAFRDRVDRENFTFGGIGLAQGHDGFAHGDEASVLDINVVLIDLVSEDGDALLMTEFDHLLESVLSKH